MKEQDGSTPSGTSTAPNLLGQAATAVRNGLRVFRDPVFALLLAPGLSAWLMRPPSYFLPWNDLLIKAFIEEIAFRGFLQETLDQRLKRRRPLGHLLSPANMIASVVFALFHLVHHGPSGLLVFFPSLLFGYAWDRYGNVIPCGLIHFFYNFCLFYRL